ncbi:MAG: hypothetical protein ACOC9B_01510 [Chloroflexota bacterium]
MEYLLFSFWFVLIHMFSYTIAGVVALRFSDDLYRGTDRLYDFLKDMADECERAHVQRRFLPAQALRGLLFSVVFYPVMDALEGLPFVALFLFVFGLMFIFTDMASASPFPHNIEGFVYMKERYRGRVSLWKLYSETFAYSLLTGLGVAVLLS